MARTLKSDKVLFVTTLLLVCASVVMVYSATAVLADQKGHNPYYFLIKQLVWGVTGLGLMLVAMRVDYHEYRRPQLIWPLLGVTCVGLLAVFLFAPVNGTHRWVGLGPLTFQPSELAKLAAIFFAAALLERRVHRINEPAYTLLPVGIVTLGLAGLILKEPDFGTATVIVLAVLTLLFAAGLSYRYLIGALLLMIPAALALIILEPYRYARLMVFLHPSSDLQGKGFQLNQSLIAVGSGGLLGKGLMGGVQKLFYLPEAHTDFIYAVIGEELGLIGTTVFLLCFLVVAWRGMRAALVAPDRFGTLLALGLTTMIALQALLNMSVVIGLLPTKGIPLPLVSNGGSSLLINLIAMGILLNISQRSSATAAATVAV